MGIIKKLDEHLINMIAAGEVVERPSGIIKELVENSIDALSSSIIVRIYEGGLSRLEVIDDGKGMDQTDACQAFFRHATSKISMEKDLSVIKTLGFRGEALPSIASVSKLELITNDTKDSTKVNYEYGKLISANSYSGNKGTSVKVEGLFYKTPARLKHLKQASYEASLVSEIVTKFAFGYPNIRFELFSDDRLVLKTLGNNNFKDCLFNIYGREYASNSLDINNNDQDFEINGLVCLPHINRANKNYIHLYINNRMIRYYKISQKIIEVFQKYMPSSRYPIVILNINCDEQLVDVNVHPSKWQIRLSKEDKLLELIANTIEKTLLANLKGINVETKLEIPKELTKQIVNEHPKVMVPLINNDNSKLKLDFDNPIIKEVEIINESLEVIKEEIIEYDIIETKDINQHDELSNLKVIGQLDEKYILASNSNGLLIFDQHATMERIRYEYYLKSFEEKEIKTQTLLVPIKLTVSPKVILQIEALNKELNYLNVNLEVFGHNDIIVREIPVWMIDLNATEFIKGLIDYYENTSKLNVAMLTKRKLATMACKSSIRFNEYVSYEGMKSLLNDLKKCDNPYQCPHSRPTFTSISYYDLEKSFNR